MRFLMQLGMVILGLPSILNAASPLTAAAIAPDGKLVVLGSQQGLELRTWPELDFAGSIESELIHIHDLQFSPDGNILLVAGGSPAEEGAVEVFEWSLRRRIQRIALHDDVVYRVAWSPDGSKWAIASGDAICSVIDRKSGERISRYQGHSRSVLSLEFLDHGKMIASVGVDQTLQVWDSSSSEHVRTLDNHVGTVNAIAVRSIHSSAVNAKPDESSKPGSLPVIVATASEDRTVRIWQPSIGRLMRFAKLPAIPRALAWSSTGDRLYVGCSDGHLRVLDFESLEMLEDIPGLDGTIYELTLDPERRRLLCVGETGFRCVELQSESPL